MSQRTRIAGLLVVATSVALPAAADAAQSDPPVAMASTISAKVTGAGAHRELTWWVLRRVNQKVTFEEHGGATPRILGTTKGGTGSLRFKPARGGKARRRIVARVELNGVPSERYTVARFTVKRAHCKRTRGTR